MPITVDQVRSLIGAALQDGRVTYDEANEILRATSDGHQTSAKLGLVKTLLETAEKRLDPDAWRALRRLLSSPTATLPPGVDPGPRTNSVLDIRLQAQRNGKRELIFIYDTGDRATLKNPRLVGTWDGDGRFKAGLNGGIPMEWIGGGRYAASVELVDDGRKHAWQWGVLNDGPLGKSLLGVMGEGPLSFDIAGTAAIVRHAPTWYHHMGSHKCHNGDIRFGLWAPNATAVSVRVQLGDRIVRLPMTRDTGGSWFVRVDQGFKEMEGKAYSYEITTSDGKTVERADPYARQMQGEQRGLSRVFVNNRTGEEVNYYFMHADIADRLVGKHHEFKKIPLAEREQGYADSRAELVRFEIPPYPGAERATLVLADPQTGRALDRDQLLARLGDFDPSMDPSLKTRLRGGTYDDLWSRHVDADGTIHLTDEGGAWGVLVNNPKALVGLKYELMLWKKDARGRWQKLVDPTNPGGRHLAFNDPWSDVITAESGLCARSSVVMDTHYDWQHDRAACEPDPKKWVIYQAHVGSFMGAGQNTRRGTFKDLCDRLGYLKQLGVNTIEMLPAGEFEGTRDWGYSGASSLAIESAYGFVDDDGQWVPGPTALKRFIDEAHRQGLNVINDVVYNHVLSDHLWEFDGPQNLYFNWSKDPSRVEVRQTEWGPIPAYNNRKVRQFFVDHAMAMVDEYRFDGLRLDFTEPIKNGNFGGGKDGWELLREINRGVHFVNPRCFTIAEQFDYDPTLTDPADRGTSGGGFDAQWYTEPQHRMTRDYNPSAPGIIQAAAEGKTPNMDGFIRMLTNPWGLTSWAKAVFMISNHDEVGNAQRTITVAQAGKAPPPSSQWARDAARLAAGVGFLCPGIPFFFQGDESLASNPFKWGVPSTWDLDWEWEKIGKDWSWSQIELNAATEPLYLELAGLDPAARAEDTRYRRLGAENRKVVDALAGLDAAKRRPTLHNMHRRQMVSFYADAIALRKSSPAFAADAGVDRVMANNADAVMAFRRFGGGEEYVVVGTAAHHPHPRYAIELPAGEWQEVLASDAARYGGNGSTNAGRRLRGRAELDLPAAGLVVLKRVR